jgi:hypothetical protein
MMLARPHCWSDAEVDYLGTGWRQDEVAGFLVRAGRKAIIVQSQTAPTRAVAPAIAHRAMVLSRLSVAAVTYEYQLDWSRGGHTGTTDIAAPNGKPFAVATAGANPIYLARNGRWTDQSTI